MLHAHTDPILYNVCFKQRNAAAPLAGCIRVTGAIDAAVEKIVAANQDKVAEYKSGKDKLFGFFVGQTMKAMAGKGNPALVNDALKRRLS